MRVDKVFVNFTNFLVVILQHCLNLCFTVLHLLHVELLGLHDCLLKTLNQLLALSKSLLM